MECQPTSGATIVVNGEARPMRSGETIESLLEAMEIEPSRVAVEVNRRIVKRSAWPQHVLDDGAQIEIVQFVGGG